METCNSSSCLVEKPSNQTRRIFPGTKINKTKKEFFFISMFSFTQGNLGKNVRRGRISSSPVRKEEEHHYQPKPLMNRTSCFCGIVFFKHGTDNKYKAGVVDLRSKGGDPATCVVYLRNETRNQIDSMTMNAAITKTLGEEETKSLLE